MNSNTIKKAEKFRALVILAIVATLSLGFYMFQGNEVTLNLDGKITEVVSYSKTVEDFIESEEIDIKDGAYISIPLDTKIKEDIKITIKNPKDYTIDDGGVLVDIKSVHTKTKDILKDAGVTLGELDYTLPELDKDISANTTIEIYRVKEIVETTEIEIPFEEEVIMNKNIDRGVINVVKEGKNGIRKSETKNKYVNGVLASTIIVKDEVTSEPVNKIVEKGTKELVVATSRGDTRYRRKITMTATAYDSSYESTGKKPGHKYYGITASGTQARPGVVAVDPSVIPLGTKLYIESLDGTKDYGFAIAEDTGGSIKGNKIDLFFNTSSECYSFGRRKVNVYILD
jgi:uncharacterized protein YabE (DUF348 family)